MQTHDKQPQRQSRTLDANPKAANQASWDVILQRYASKTTQLHPSEKDEELLQEKSEPVQRQELPDEDELLQGKFDDTIQQKEEKEVNNTGLPDDLKTGVENLSGFSMDDIHVHYNSDKPAQLNALAYAQGSDIHIGPGQEKHLPHEAWHVVQQKQGRVQPTMQMHGTKVNDDNILEKEADNMVIKSLTNSSVCTFKKSNPSETDIIQQKIYLGDNMYTADTDDNQNIQEAASDIYNRRYENDADMRKHLSGQQSKYGLIKKLALWYKIPFLDSNTFFVLGESHAAVRGTDIAKASNITLDKVFYEGHLDSWTNDENINLRYSEGNKSPDEKFSKLLRALEVVKFHLNRPQEESPSVDKIPEIPMGKKSIRKTDDGTYRLVIKDELGKEKFWKMEDTAEVNEPTAYNALDEAINAVKKMLLDKSTQKVIKAQFKDFKHPDYINVRNALIFFENRFENSDLTSKNYYINVLRYAITTVIKNQLKLSKDAKSDTADKYRDDFMLDAIKNVPSGRFSFAAIGDMHLKNIRSELGDIPSISKDEFYTNNSIDAIDIP